MVTFSNIYNKKIYKQDIPLEYISRGEIFKTKWRMKYPKHERFPYFKLREHFLYLEVFHFHSH